MDETCPGAEVWLRELLEQTFDKLLDCGDLAAQFVAVARLMLTNGALSPCPVKYSEEPSGGTIYYDETTLGFTAPALNAVCQRLGQSRPVVLHALREAGLLLGKRINSGTLLTRISVWNSYGIPQTERVYKLPRSAFDQLGDPLVFAGEGSL